MVVGESGLGKSTLVNSMFLTDIYSTDYPGPSDRLKKTINVEATKVYLKVRINEIDHLKDQLQMSLVWLNHSNLISKGLKSDLKNSKKKSDDTFLPGVSSII